MRRTAVDSSVIASIGYDSAKCELEIEFLESGDVYRYFEVPSEEYQAFMAAESKGTYLNTVFKRRAYRYAVVRYGRRDKLSKLQLTSKR